MVFSLCFPSSCFKNSLTGIRAKNSDVLSLSMIDTDLYTCSANGWVQVRVRHLVRPLGHSRAATALVCPICVHGVVARARGYRPLIHHHKHIRVIIDAQGHNCEWARGVVLGHWRK